MLALDANDDVQSGMLADTLRQRQVDILEASRRVHPTLPAFSTFGSGGRPGSRQIDGVFLSHDLCPDELSWLSVSTSPGDHRALVLDIKWKALLGKGVQKIVRPEARRLNCSMGMVRMKYLVRLSLACRQAASLEKTHVVVQSMTTLPRPDTLLLLADIDRVRT